MVSQASSLPRYQRLVDGFVLPATLAGEPVLEFCNTRAGWGGDAPREYLTSYEHLLAWARDARLVPTAAAERLRRRAHREPQTAERVLARALALRDAIYAACTERGAADAWETVAAAARAATRHAQLVPGAPPGARWVISERAGLELPLLEVARAAGTYLGTADLGRVRACPGANCGWLFVDARGRRRWCTMEVCGNRAKARRHATRTRRRD